MILLVSVLIAIAVFTLTYLVIESKSDSQSVKDVHLRSKLGNVDAAAAMAMRSADRAYSKSRRTDTAIKLGVAGLSWRPAEWLILNLLVAVGFAVTGWILSGWVFGVIGFIFGYLLAQLWLRWKISRARGKFEEDLPGVLQLVAGSLSSGMALSQALDVVCADGREPMVGELRRALSRDRLGVPLVVSFEEIADRMKSMDFEWVALAIRIQKEVGGNLSEILSGIAETVRERAYLHRQVKTLSAEGRLSAYILIGLPFAVGGYLMLTRPEYLAPLWETGMGWAMSASATVMLGIGWAWMRQTIKIEV